MQVDMHNFLPGDLAIGDKEVDSLARQT